MKRSVLFFALLAVAATAGAQRNDLYSTGKSSKKSVTVSTQSGTPAATVDNVTRVPAGTSGIGTMHTGSNQERDVDEYNRRYSAGSSSSYSQDYDGNTVYIHDTVFVNRTTDDSWAYREGYSDAVDDFYATRLLTRFHRPALRLSLTYDPLYRNYLYFDTWYDPWYDPWYYDSWYWGYSYYDPWYYSSWHYYDPWYGPYGHYGYRYPAYPVYVSSHDRYVPNRQINSGGWDRNLSARNSRGSFDGSKENRRVSSGVKAASSVSSRSTNVRTDADRTVTNRSVGAQGSAARRGVSSSSSSFDRPSSTSTTTRSVSAGNSNATRSVSGTKSSNAGSTSKDETRYSSSRSVSRNSGSAVRGENTEAANRSISSSTSRSISSSSSNSNSSSRSVSSSSSSSSSRSVSSSSSSSSRSSMGSSSSSGSRSVSSGGGSRGASGSSSRR